MSTRSTDQEQIQAKELALCRTALSRVLSLTFYHPTSDSLAALASKKTRAAVVHASSLLAADGSEYDQNPAGSVQEDHTVDLIRRCETWLNTFSSLTLDSFQSAHGYIFGHTARGTVPPYETEYGQEGLFQQPQQLASLVGFYEVFGLRVRQIERERPDHISCELEFLEFLSRKEAYALENNDDSMLKATRRAIRLFLKEHLGRFGRAFGRGLKKHDRDGFFGQAGDVLFDFLTLQCRQLGIEAGPSRLPLRSAAEDQVPMACAGESELIQIET